MNSNSGRQAIKLPQIETSFNSTGSMSSPSISSTPQGGFPTYIAINEYTKRMEDELDMKPGDKIQVITDDQEYNDGWYYGRNLRTNEEGLYPKVFTQVISTQKQPSLMRAKSSRRVVSPFGGGSTTNLSNFSNDGSTSELPTPQPLETAASVSIAKNGKHVVDRNISVKSTMSDIDRALEELRGESLANSSQLTSDIVTNDSYTRQLDTSENNADISTSSPTHSLNNDSSFAVTTVNGIETKGMEPLLAKSWSPEQVTAYFIATGFDVESASRFQQHRISGSILLELELAHLKELDINSFGTRFEMFKEIEAIKDVVSRNRMPSKHTNQLMPAAAVNQRTYMSHVQKTSHPIEDVPSRSFSNTPTEEQILMSTLSSKQAPVSLVVPQNSLSDSSTTPVPIIESVFLSPRRAPKPPSYPSPVQPPKSPMVSKASPNRSPMSSTFTPQHNQKYQHPTIYEKATQNSAHPYRPGGLNSPMYEFPQKLEQTTSSTPALPNPYASSSPSVYDENRDENYPGNRGSVLYSGQHKAHSHRKTKSGGSFVELFNRISMLSMQNDEEGEGDDEEIDLAEELSQKASSSVYGHSRTTSVNHIRHPSQVSNSEVKKHRRNSSILSFFNKQEDVTKAPSPTKRSHSTHNSYSHSRRNSFISPFKQSLTSDSQRNTPIVNQAAATTSPLIAPSPTEKKLSPEKKDAEKRRSVSAKEPITSTSEVFFDAKDDNFTSTDSSIDDKKKKRSVSEAVRAKTLRSVSTKAISKKQTSAFTEGIRTVGVNEAMKDADCSGWMSKKGAGAMGVWKNRFFTLHGTRLSYFSSINDTRERGLIDITAHRVVPAKEDDKFVALYAASTGKGRYCFKLIPPQPGSKKGLTFTQPRVHYFAVDSKDDMRAWMAALIKATIDIDTSVPIISSCATPTVSLSKAQEMLSQAREETRLREEQRYLNEEDEDQMLWEQQHQQQLQLQEDIGNETSANTSSINNNTTLTPGFQSPYLLASGVLSPNIVANGTPKNSGRFPDQQADYFGLDPKYLGERI